MTRAEKLHSYHKRKAQKLEDNYESRVAFCRHILQLNEENQNVLKHVLWTDESLFTREGCFNTHNEHEYALENPRTTVNKNFQRKWKVNMWGGIGDSYLIFLQEVLPKLLQELPRQDRPEWYQHDGAPAHYAGPIRTYLNRQYPGRWFGRNAPLLWPPKSPDLTPLNFDEPADEEETLARLMAANELITSEKLEEVRQNLLRRYQLCIDVNGGHFEQLLN